MYTLYPIQDTELNRLHFNYTVEDLQNEVEKRTSYLGKFRKTDEAAHLQDLISMTKDEENLFIPLAKDSMMEVCDVLRKGAMLMPYRYCEWKEKENVLDVKVNPLVTLDEKSLFLYSSALPNSIEMGGEFALNEVVDYSSYNAEVEVTVEYETEFHSLLPPSTPIYTIKTVTFRIPVVYDALAGLWLFSSMPVPVELEPATPLVSAEVINSVVSYNFTGNVYAVNKTAHVLNVGDIIEHDGGYYKLLVDTNINSLDLDKDAQQIDPLDINGGIHYYIYVPQYLHKRFVAPLDIALLESLVNKVILKWLLFSYPKEAETYIALDKQKEEQIYSRSSIFKNTVNKVPRIL